MPPETPTAADRKVPPGASGGWAFWVLPSFGSFLFLAALSVGVVVLGAEMFRGDGDAGRHIRLGLYMLQTGSIPRVDHFSFTMAGQPFVPYEWLSEVLYALAYRLEGLAGVGLLAGLLLAAATYVPYATSRRLGVAGPLALLFGVLAFRLEALHLLPRPHLFTMLLAAVTTAILLGWSREGRSRHLRLLPLLMLFWVNLHGGFLVGFLLLGVFLVDAALDRLAAGRGEEPGRQGPGAEERRARAGGRLKELGLVTALCLAVTLLNPAGPAIWTHTLGYLGSHYLVNHTQEYLSPDFHVGGLQVFMATLLLAFALGLAGKARPTRAEGMLVLLWTAASLYSARNVPIFAVAALPVVARWTQATIDGYAAAGSGAPARARRLLEGFLGWMERMSRVDARVARRPLFLAVGSALLVLWTLGPGRSRLVFQPSDFPVAAVRELKRDPPPGHVFNQFIWGGYLLFAWPEQPVFIDGQTDFYGAELTREYSTAVEGRPGWSHVLDEHHVGWTLTRTDQPLNQLLALSPDWTMVYQDSVATAYRRCEASCRSGGGPRY